MAGSINAGQANICPTRRGGGECNFRNTPRLSIHCCSLKLDFLLVRTLLKAIPIFLINKGSAAMHQEVLALAESSGILFSRESPDLVDEAAAALSEEVGGPQLIPATGVSGRMFTLTAGTSAAVRVALWTQH